MNFEPTRRTICYAVYFTENSIVIFYTFFISVYYYNKGVAILYFSDLIAAGASLMTLIT